MWYGGAGRGMEVEEEFFWRY